MKDVNVEREYWEAVAASPSDDAPRYAYATYLDSVGDHGHADFIRAQLDAAIVDPWDDAALKATERVPDERVEWASEISSVVTAAEIGAWRRGFPDEYRAPNLRSLVREMPLAFERFPCTRLTGALPGYFPRRATRRGFEAYLGEQLNWVERFLETGWFDRLRGLDLELDESALLPILLSRPHLLRRLDFWPGSGDFDGHDQGDNVLEDVLHAPGTRELESLSLREPDRNGSSRTRHMGQALSGAPLYPNLQRLGLRGNLPGPGLQTLFGNLPALTQLSLRETHASTLSALIGSGLTDRLVSLDLRKHHGNVQALQTCDLGRLKSLCLERCTISVAELREILARTAVLRRLDLRGVQLGAAGMLCLCREPRMKTLRALNLEGCGMDSRDLEELIRSPHLENLRWLQLGLDWLQFDPAVRGQVEARYRTPGSGAFD